MKSEVEPTRCDENRDERALVTSATAHLLSLDRQPLPAGYGFALINREGRALYHSDGRLSLRENLYDELREGGRARAIVYAGKRDELKSRYRERPHMFYLYPVGLFRAGEPPRARQASTWRSSATPPSNGPWWGMHSWRAWSVRWRSSSASAWWGCGVLRLPGERFRHHWSAWLWPHGGLQPSTSARPPRSSCCSSAAARLMYHSIGGTFLLTPVLAAALGLGIYVRGPRKAHAAGSPLPAGTPGCFLVLVFMVIAPSAGVVPSGAAPRVRQVDLDRARLDRAQKGTSSRLGDRSARGQLRRRATRTARGQPAAILRLRAGAL